MCAHTTIHGAIYEGKLKTDIYAKIKARKPFEVNDVLVYFFLLFSVSLLFLFFVFLPSKEGASGFNLYLKDEEIFTFHYQDKSYSIAEGYENFIEVNLEKNTVTVFLDEYKTEYNVLSFNTDNQSVVMVNSTCSHTKDCVYEPAISSFGTIYCAPHHLTVTPVLQGGTETPPVIGGGI